MFDVVAAFVVGSESTLPQFVVPPGEYPEVTAGSR
jgi:hypothetical protein